VLGESEHTFNVDFLYLRPIRFASCGEAKMELFDYIEVFYNQRRRHSTLGQISPAEFERRKNREAKESIC
jgi:Integrase core domain